MRPPKGLPTPPSFLAHQGLTCARSVNGQPRGQQHAWDAMVLRVTRLGAAPEGEGRVDPPGGAARLKVVPPHPRTPHLFRYAQQEAE